MGLFRKGERVEWARPDTEFQEKHGTGPFIVHALRDVPGNEMEGAGHPQWIVLRDEATGRLTEEFSGSWLRRASRR